MIRVVHAGKCFLIRVPDRQYVAGAGLKLQLNLDSMKMYGDLAPAMFEGAYMQIDHTHDPSRLEQIMLHPGMYTNVQLQVYHSFS